MSETAASRPASSSGVRVVGMVIAILEINPNHPLVTRLKYEGDEGTRFADWSHILFDQAMLAEGGSLADPATFVKRLNEMLLATTK